MMALNALEEPGEKDRHEASEKDIERWQYLFNYSCTEAANLIEERRRNFSRNRVSDEHWEFVQSDTEAQSYDREAYEHSLEIDGKRISKDTVFKGKPVTIAPALARATYTFKLERPLDTLEKVQHAAELSDLPIAIQGIGEDGDASFCRVNGEAKQAITNWISAQKSKFKPTFVRVSQAEKDLSRDSIYPTLSLDTTLPQNRPVSTNAIFQPAQNQYPVWYFFYGTLCDSTILSHQLSLPEDKTPVLEPASTTGGILRTWAGKYQALVDGPPNASVKGSAYEVISKEHEDALRSYETDNYEVVRCTISIEGRQVQGCTFRFVGSLDTN